MQNVEYKYRDKPELGSNLGLFDNQDSHAKINVSKSMIVPSNSPPQVESRRTSPSFKKSSW